MPIFKINGTKLSPINEIKIDLEKDIQNLTEQNLEDVFGLEFVCSEFALNNFRIDTLAFDKETNSFVIIEYKRDRNFSVVDQGYAYLSLMLNNKAEFILEYQDKKESNINRNEIDWEQSKVIFIANAFTPHQQQAIQFKGLPIELWKVRRYDNETLLYNQIEAAESSVSITTVSKDKTVQSVSREVKKFTIEDHLSGKNSLVKELYDGIKTVILNIDSRIEESPRKDSIAFKIGGRGICWIRIQSNSLRLALSKTHPDDLKDPQNKVTYLEKSFEHSHQNISSMIIRNQEDIQYALYIIKQAYQNNFK